MRWVQTTVSITAWFVLLGGSPTGAVEVHSTVEALRELVIAGHYADAETGGRELLARVEAESGKDSPAAAEVLDVLVEALWRGGKAADPETRALGQRAVDIREKALGPDDPAFAKSLHTLAAVSVESGEYSEGRSLYQRALAIRERSLGPDHMDVARTLNNLGNLLSDTGDLAGARSLYERSLAIREKLLGPDHPDLATALSALAVLLAKAADYRAAKPVFERVLRIREEALGPDHLSVAESVSNLANLMFKMGRYAEARHLAERALQITEKALGPNHPRVAKALGDLASLLHTVGESAQARLLYERALRILERTLGPGHPEVANIVNNLAVVHEATGDYAAARSLYERALRIQEKTFGMDNVETTGAMASLGGVRSRQGDFGGAQRVLERALAIRENNLGSGHPKVADILEKLATVGSAMGDYPTALTLNEKALAIRERSLGPDHPDVGMSLHNLASVLQAMGDYAGARVLLERSIAISEKTFGPDSPDLALGLNNLATLLTEVGDLRAARLTNERALKILEEARGLDHPEVAISLHNLGSVLLEQGDLAGARPLFERALVIHERTLGANHPDVASVLVNLGILFVREGDYAAARASYERALGILEKAVGPDHPELGTCLDRLATLHLRMGDYAGARPLYEQVVSIQERALGPDHPDLADTLGNLAELFLLSGDDAPALEASLRAAAIVREGFQRTARGLSEREALEYEKVNASGLGVAITSLAATPSGTAPERAVRRVLDAVIRSRALVLDEMVLRHRTLLDSESRGTSPHRASLDRTRNRLARLMVRGPEPYATRSYRGQVRIARAEMERQERALAEKSRIFRADQTRRRIGLRELLASLPAESALVAYVRYERPALPKEGGQPGGPAVPSYVAFVLRAGEGAPAVVELGRADRIDERVRRWREEAASPPGEERSVAPYEAAGGELRRSIWDPLVPHIGVARRVFVVPDGALGLVSLATLAKVDGRYLLESEPVIHYLSAERDLVPSPAPHPSGRGLLVVGGPDFDWRSLRVGVASKADASCEGLRALRFEPLASAQAEAEEVESIWMRGHPLDGPSGDGVLKRTGAAATETALKQEAPGRRIVHIATHAFFLEDVCASESGTTLAVSRDHPLQLTGLALAGANQRAEGKRADRDEDGVLTAEEIAALDLRAVEWVVLSACETGVGPVQSGEGVLGLRRSFEVSGARTLIMSLWAVEDHTARAWIRRLYTGRLAGLSTADAVRRASLELLQDRRRSGLSQHPFFWGGFVAAGEWR